MFEIDNGKINLRLSDDARHLEIRSGNLCYENDSFIQAVYGMSIALDLAAYGECQIVKRDNALTIGIDHVVWYARFPGHGYIKPEPSPEIKYTFKIALEGEEVVFATEAPEGLDDEMLQVIFPNDALKWHTGDSGSFIGCIHSFGSLYSYPSAEKHETYAQPILPVAGYFTSGGGIGIRMGEEYDSFLRFRSNVYPNSGSCCFVHEFARGKSEYTRKVRMRFFPARSDYTSLAKWHRQGVVNEQRFVALKQKCEEIPEIKKLAGSVIWKHNVFACKSMPENIRHDYSLYVRSRAAGEAEGRLNNWTANEVFDAAHKAGFDKVCIFNTGWNCYGFDSGYPTRFPVNPLRGTDDDFREAAAYGKSLSEDYVLSVHDNYRDVYRNSPEFSFGEILRNVDNVPVKGDIWRGGRSYLMCSKCARKYAERDLPRIAGLFGRGAIYLDVQGCVELQNCYSKQHGGSRRDDAIWRIEVFKEAARHIGAVATEGGPLEFAIPHVALGAYPAIKENNLSNLRLIPFFQLVYHDSILSFAGQGVSGVYGADYSNRVALYGLLPWDFSGASLAISRKMRNSCFAEMLSHKFLSDKLEKTEFSDGTTVIANFSDSPIEDVPANGFVIKNIGKAFCN